MDLKRLTRKMRALMYSEGPFGPEQRDRILRFVEKAWKQLEEKG